MSLGDRIAERRRTMGYSQSRLAREAGVSQPTIGKLEVGMTSGSSHLHRIARALETTPAYLTGETDDPAAEAPELPAVSREDRQFLQYLNTLPATAKAAFTTLVRTFSGQSSAVQQESWALPSEAELTAMYQAQLQAFARLQGDDLARALAKRLPRALARLQDVTTYTVTEPLGEEPEGVEPPATDHHEPQQAQRK